MSHLVDSIESEWSKQTDTKFSKLGLDASSFFLYFLFKNILPITEGISAINEIKDKRLFYVIAPHSSWLDTILIPYFFKINKLKHPRSVARSNSNHDIWGYIQTNWYKSFIIDHSSLDNIDYLRYISGELTLAAEHDDILLYYQGGRSYTGRYKKPNKLSFNSFVSPTLKDAFIVPVTITYDLVLEDEILINIWKKSEQKKFSEELPEIIRFPNGPAWHYKSKAYIFFGNPLPIRNYLNGREGKRNAFIDTEVEIAKNRKITEVAIFSAAVIDGFVEKTNESKPIPFITFLSQNQLEDNIGKYINLVKDKSQLVNTDTKRIIEVAAFYLGLRDRVKISKSGVYIDNSHKTLNFYANTIENLLLK